jgi:hypothetical protein
MVVPFPSATGPERSAVLQRTAVTWFIALVALAVHFLPGAVDMLEFDRQALAAGEWWRYLTGYVTHWSTNHLFWDVLMFVVLGCSTARFSGHLRCHQLQLVGTGPATFLRCPLQRAPSLPPASAGGNRANYLPPLPASAGTFAATSFSWWTGPQPISENENPRRSHRARAPWARHCRPPVSQGGPHSVDVAYRARCSTSRR